MWYADCPQELKSFERHQKSHFCANTLQISVAEVSHEASCRHPSKTPELWYLPLAQVAHHWWPVWVLGCSQCLCCTWSVTSFTLFTASVHWSKVCKPLQLPALAWERICFCSLAQLRYLPLCNTMSDWLLSFSFLGLKGSRLWLLHMLWVTCYALDYLKVEKQWKLLWS